MKEIDLKNCKEVLCRYTKVIVTGPPRSGTTITSLILATELNYKFVDESMYDGGDVNKFMLLISHPRKMVIQNTAFSRDLHKIPVYYPTCFVVSKRELKDIYDSMKNSEKFMKTKDPVHNGKQFFGFNAVAKMMVAKHYGCNPDTLAEDIYATIFKNAAISNHADYCLIHYKSLRNHPRFISRGDRRKNFTHLKQVDFDPEYIKKRGVIVL